MGGRVEGKGQRQERLPPPKGVLSSGSRGTTLSRCIERLESSAALLQGPLSPESSACTLSRSLEPAGGQGLVQAHCRLGGSFFLLYLSGCTRSLVAACNISLVAAGGI